MHGRLTCPLRSYQPILITHIRDIVDQGGQAAMFGELVPTDVLAKVAG